MTRRPRSRRAGVRARAWRSRGTSAKLWCVPAKKRGPAAGGEAGQVLAAQDDGARGRPDGRAGRRGGPGSGRRAPRCTATAGWVALIDSGEGLLAPAGAARRPVAGGAPPGEEVAHLVHGHRQAQVAVAPAPCRSSPPGPAPARSGPGCPGPARPGSGVPDTAGTRATPAMAWPTGSSAARARSTCTTAAGARRSGGGSRWRRTLRVEVRGKSGSGHQEALARRWCWARRPLARATDLPDGALAVRPCAAGRGMR